MPDPRFALLKSAEAEIQTALEVRPEDKAVNSRLRSLLTSINKVTEIIDARRRWT